MTKVGRTGSPPHPCKKHKLYILEMPSANTLRRGQECVLFIFFERENEEICSYERGRVMYMFQQVNHTDKYRAKPFINQENLINPKPLAHVSLHSWFPHLSGNRELSTVMVALYERTVPTLLSYCEAPQSILIFQTLLYRKIHRNLGCKETAFSVDSNSDTIEYMNDPWMTLFSTILD